MCKLTDWVKNIFKKSDEKCPFDIKTSSFPWSEYGIGIHDVFQSIDEYKKAVTSSGPYLRTDIPWWEVGEKNFSRTDEFLNKCEQATKELGFQVLPIIVVRGWTNTPYADKSDIQMQNSMPQAQREEAGYKLAKRLAERVKGRVFCIESWNEPDHDNPENGFYLSTGEDRWTAFKSHLLTTTKAFREAGIKTAFCPFMTLNDTKASILTDVWKATQQNFDFFSFHYYDDDPSKICYYATQIAKLVADRPTLCTEHGSQSDKSQNYYRQSAWAIKTAFKNFVVVLNYCYDGDNNWQEKDKDLVWNVTHDSKP